MRCLIDRPIAATLLLLATLGMAAPALAEAPAAGTSTYSQAEIDALRAQIEEIRDTYLELAETTSPEMLEVMSMRLAPLDELSDGDLANLKISGIDFAPLVDAAAEMRDLTENRRDLARFEVQTKSAGFPNAAYTSICGSRRSDASAMFAAGRVLQVAEGVFSIADRACNQVAVAAGFGGNTSAACIAADTVLAAARYAFDTFAACDAEIDSVEIEGSYDRLGHLHGDISSLDAKVSTEADGVIRNDNVNRNAIVANDNANRDALGAQAEANTALLLARAQTLADQGKSREVENFLRVRECTAWMYTPASMGGELDFVLDVVDRVIGDARALGSVAPARLATAAAAAAQARSLASSMPLDATNFCRAIFLAYADATPSNVDRVPVSGVR